MRALLLLLLATSTASAQGTGTLAGRVLEADSVTAVIGANVRVEGTTLGAATDIDGNYRITGVPVGTYSVTALYVGYMAVSIEGVVITDAGITPLDLTFQTVGPGCILTIDDSEIGWPLTSTDVYAGRILRGREVENMPVNR